jgi:hypothetical protein
MGSNPSAGSLNRRLDRELGSACRTWRKHVARSGRLSDMVTVMRPVRVRSLCIVAALLVLASACGGDGSDVEAVGPSAATAEEQDGEWITHTLGRSVPDREIVGAAMGDGVAVLTVEEPGAVRGYRLEADGTLEEASVDIGASASRMVTAITDGPKGLVATGNDLQPDFTNFVLTSPDGTSWTNPTTTGLEKPMDVHDLMATDERYVAVGSLRTAEDPSRGGFVPAIVLSDDGTTWSPALTPSSEEGWISSVVSLGTTMYAAGDVGGASVVWSSADGGQTWAASTSAPPADHILASGEVLLAVDSAGEGGRTIHRSDDDGATWQAQDASFLDGFGLSSFFGESGFAIRTAAEVHRALVSSPELCYADIEQCDPQMSVDDQALLVSADGVGWNELALDALTGLLRPSVVLHNTSGDTVVLGKTADGAWAAWMWDSSQGRAPTATRSNDVPQYDGPPIVRSGATLEQGKRYAYPLYIHCGMDQLGEFNGAGWELVELPTGDRPETGGGVSPPDHWPVVQQSIIGFLALVTEDRIEYSLDDGEVIGVYAPRPANSPPVGCM